MSCSLEASTAVVVYVGPKLASAHDHWCLTEVAGAPLLVHALGRMRMNPFFAGCDLWILLHGPACGPIPLETDLRKAVAPTGAGLRVSRMVNCLGVLDSFAKETDYKTIAVFPENAIFPDLKLSRVLVDAHAEADADATWAVGAPLGLSPDIYRSDAIVRLASLGLPQDMSARPITVMQHATQICAGNTDLEFRLRPYRVEQDGEYRGPLTDLLLTDHAGREAAERVITSGVDDGSDRAARAFGRELAQFANGDSPVLSDAVPLVRGDGTGTRRVLYATLASALSGAEVSFSRLIAAAQCRGIRPIVSIPARSELSRRLTSAGVEWEIAELDLSRLSLEAYNYYQRLILRNNVDLVHIDSFPIPALVMAAVASGRPIVQHMRVVPSGRSPDVFGFESAFIAISQTVRRGLLRSGVSDQKVHVVYNGITLDFPEDACSPVSAIVETGGPLIAMIARIDRHKRQDLLLNALPKVCSIVPGIRVVFVGEVMPGEYPYCAKLAESIRDLSLHDKVSFLGFEPNITSLYGKTSVLVLCSDLEPLGICLLEAAASGICIVAPRSGGPGEVFSDGFDALLYDAGDSDQLASCLLRVLTGLHLRTRLGANARSTAARYTVERYAADVLQVYDKVCAKLEG